MKLDLSELPDGVELFDALRGGKHIDQEEGKLYFGLAQHFETFQALFGYLGFELRRHERGFYYFEGSGASASLGKRARQFSVFFFVFVDALSEEGESAVESLFRVKGHRISELPHFERARHRECLKEVGLENEEDLEDLIKSMERYNLVVRTGAGEFRFRDPAWRFLELCYAYAEMGEEQDERGGEEG